MQLMQGGNDHEECHDFVQLSSCVFFYLHKGPFPLLKRLRRKKEYYSRLNDFIYAKLISSTLKPHQIEFNPKHPWHPSINLKLQNSCIAAFTDSGAKQMRSFDTDYSNASLFHCVLPLCWRNGYITSLPKKQQSAHVP